MKKKGKSKALLVYLGLLVALAVGAFLFQKLEIKKAGNEKEEGSECIEGEVMSCSIEGCEGVKRCIKGQWSACTWERVCTPGEKVPCNPNACSLGYKICNKCGTAFSECII